MDTNLGSHSYVKLKNIKFHYVECGNKQAPLIFLLHGFPDCWFSWQYQLPELSKYYHCIAVDLKGFGESDKPINKNLYSINTIIEELEEFITIILIKKYANNTKNKSIILIGHDLGAILSWYLIYNKNINISKFISISSIHPNEYITNLINTTGNIFNIKWLYITQLPYIIESDIIYNDLNIIDLIYKHYNNNINIITAYKYCFKRFNDWIGPLNYFRNIPYIKINNNIHTNNTNINTDELTHQIYINTLFIVGNKDPFIQLDSIIKSTNYCGYKFLIKIIDNAEHFPHQQYPKECNDIIFNFHITGVRDSSVANLMWEAEKGDKDKVVRYYLSAIQSE
ncbi:epoxide hydrolase 4-like [Chrysoperla carnea]|uniref:epoxide hydrolase 4-like n=1 Tax=Chrysoperla carnea TaxID=189513 RepID=UPI001D063E42|nr:epoxide hydrolase 4-like [Chrysoperla carnea]